MDTILDKVACAAILKCAQIAIPIKLMDARNALQDHIIRGVCAVIVSIATNAMLMEKESV